MKLIHLSDLHLGKKIKEFDLIEDQEFILKQIIKVIDDEKPDAVLIAGDVYDKTIPPVSAITVFEEFLISLSKRKIQTFIISGNHDSAERMTFGSALMDLSGIHFAKAFSAEVCKYTLKDKTGDINIYLLPFIKPSIVKNYFPDKAEAINSYTDAVKVCVDAMNVDTSQQNILLSHQFVTGAVRSESEEIVVGGSENVDVTVYKDFDYVALGHIHGPQKIGKETVRYSGTPLKYSFSECNHKKSVPVIELKEKDNVEVKLVPLSPMRDLKEIKGSYQELMSKAFYDNLNLNDFYHITLTDEEEILNGFSRLQTVYKNLLKIDYENARSEYNNKIFTAGDVSKIDPLTLFNDFYKLQNNVDLSLEQSEYLKDLIEKIWEE